MQAAILTIGDEILLGQITDTNSAYMAHQLALTGIPVSNILSIADKGPAIIEALNRLLPRHNLILITGGLGPTKDDLTKKTLSEYFGDELVLHEPTLRHVEKLTAARGFTMNPLNRDQALLPAHARILHNEKGTAMGMWFERDDKVVVSLPGVPFEMEHLMRNRVLPLLKERYPHLMIDYRMALVYNIAESTLAVGLDEFERQMPAGMGLAYLPSSGLVKLRLTAESEAMARLDACFEKLCARLNELGLTYFAAKEEESDGLQHHIGRLLREKGLTLSTAESCTGGYIAHLITSVAGSSDYFKGSVVSYSNEIKEKVLGVKAETLAAHGAVSGQTVKEMARGVRTLCGTDYAIATSGVAGPGGGTPEKPVGTVWIALAGPDGECTAQCYHFAMTRERNIAKAAAMGLTLLFNELRGEKSNGTNGKI